MAATRIPLWKLGGLVATLAILSLLFPPAGHAARPMPGKWIGTDPAMSLIDFRVKGKKAKPRLIDFTRSPSPSYTCPGTGEQISTEVSGLDARVSRKGAFSSTTTSLVGSTRPLTVTLNGRFTSPRKASGTLLMDLRELLLRMERPAPQEERADLLRASPVPVPVCVPIQIPDPTYWICIYWR